MLAGCGFQPVYMATSSGAPGVARRELAAISVDIIPDRPGQLLRQALQARFEAQGGGIARRYALQVDYSVAGEGLGIQQDNSVTRIRLSANANWTLRAQDPQRTIVETGRARALDAYNVVDEQLFAADLEGEVVQHRLAERVADEITQELASRFRKRTLARDAS